MNDDARRIELIADLFAAYRKPADARELTAYVAHTADLPLDVLDAAIRVVVRQRPWLPSVAELRDLVAEAVTGVPSPSEAWAEVMRTVRDQGIYRAPAWSHPAVEAAVRAIGYRVICLSEEDELGKLRKDFWMIYETYRTRTLRAADLTAIAAFAPKELPHD